MPHIMLVEPDNNLARALRVELIGAGFRLTIVSSFAAAVAGIRDGDSIDHIITEAVLPDGSGIVFAQDARRLGKCVFVLRKRRGRIIVYDRDGTAFFGDGRSAGRFLVAALSTMALPSPPGPANTNSRTTGRSRTAPLP
jgi:CheY-like chemotaxis protein